MMALSIIERRYENFKQRKYNEQNQEEMKKWDTVGKLPKVWVARLEDMEEAAVGVGGMRL